MKPRPVMISIETVSGVSTTDLRKVRGGSVTLEDANGLLFCKLTIEQIQLNVIRTPKAAKKLVRK